MDDKYIAFTEKLFPKSLTDQEFYLILLEQLDYIFEVFQMYLDQWNLMDRQWDEYSAIAYPPGEPYRTPVQQAAHEESYRILDQIRQLSPWYAHWFSTDLNNILSRLKLKKMWANQLGTVKLEYWRFQIEARLYQVLVNTVHPSQLTQNQKKLLRELEGRVSDQIEDLTDDETREEKKSSNDDEKSQVSHESKQVRAKPKKLKLSREKTQVYHFNKPKKLPVKPKSQLVSDKYAKSVKPKPQSVTNIAVSDEIIESVKPKPRPVSTTNVAPQPQQPVSEAIIQSDEQSVLTVPVVIGNPSNNPAVQDSSGLTFSHVVIGLSTTLVALLVIARLNRIKIF